MPLSTPRGQALQQLVDQCEELDTFHALEKLVLKPCNDRMLGGYDPTCQLEKNFLIYEAPKIIKMINEREILEAFPEQQ